MAVPGMDASLLELASTLDLARVPDKLHCAACHGLLINAYKTGCCESSLCEPCFSKAADACPVCDHKPFSDEICKPSKAMRNTVKAYLKTQERARAEELAQATTVVPTIEQPSLSETLPSTQINGENTGKPQTKGSTEPLQDGRPTTESVPPAEVPQPSIEVPTEPIEPTSDVNDVDVDDDDEVVIQVESDEQHFTVQHESSDEDNSYQQTTNTKNRGGMRDVQPQRRPSEHTSTPMRNGDLQNATSSMGFGNMDYAQMMQMMTQGTMNGFNPLMGMPMSMMPMANMFNGFTGPNGNMNGMNMGMNFNQNMFNGYGNQNNNMWQNNNGNSFPNGMAEFASNFGFNLNQQQQFPNGDFQPGYNRGFGRGRGRGRGGYGRGRGGFQPYPQNYNQNMQGAFEQQQQQFQQQMQQHFDSQNSQNHTQSVQQAQEPSVEHAIPTETIEDSNSEIEEFAPGGQEDVMEALGEDYNKPTPKSEIVSTPDAEKLQEEATFASTAIETDEIDGATSTAPNGILTPTESRPATPEAKPEVTDNLKISKPIPAAYEEDLEHAMPPPSAPLGPSGRYGDNRDYGFRARGHGRYGSRGRGSIHITNIRPVSPVRRDSVPQTLPTSEPKGTGVQGAPTGPRAMREPAPTKPVRTASSGGFQIMGRAALASQSSQPPSNERKRSLSPGGGDEYRDEYKSSKSRTESRHDTKEISRFDDEDSDRYSRERDRKRRKSKYDDYEEQKVVQRENPPRSREDSPERKPSHRSQRDRDRAHEKDKYSTESKHRSSSSRKHYSEDINGYDHEDVDDYGQPVESNRDGKDANSQYRSSTKHRSSKSSKHEDVSNTTSSGNKHREDRHRDRKRSRHERDYDEDYPEEDEYDNSNHRSRRHKRDHQHSSTHRQESLSTANERPTSHRTSETNTPTAIASARSLADANKDPHTLEREARNRERMLKEQQRREQAASADKRSSAKGVTSTGRRMTFRSEDEAERRMLENERATARRR